ncbi:MAG: F0F1 ATP synthase subunit delta [Marinilabiliales bacterium]|nr:F0F1 ATP synthase subunit delta [Marinilabiliales bacterium]
MTQIIGGFILRVDDNYIDASVRTKLRKIQKGTCQLAAYESVIYRKRYFKNL